ncbi:MAG: Rnf-Nqr domain containing protein [Candidatus Delongbacteria bacterium]|jgi:Na+-transporting NADH:ubiquinone oxidoreductase subunit E|nr:Rnf-Nqr domain containing protein [Candidatus Delongbacteria bacterium]MDD4205938.1 Rnf-Nqr domain containing protein [Candidatus Delongbacteria bacterium]
MNEGIGVFGIFFAAVFTSNILLTMYLGMCSFLAVSRHVKTAFGLGSAVIFVMTATSAINWLVYNYLLKPFDLDYLMYIVFIIVIAAFVQIVEMIIERVSETLYTALGIFLPLITVNCAILGVSLFMIIRNYTFSQSVSFGLGSGVGWMIAIVAMAGIRERLANARIPKGLEGAGISLIIAGIMSMAFMGFTGMLGLG